jgi:hypothetical protein
LHDFGSIGEIIPHRLRCFKFARPSRQATGVPATPACPAAGHRHRRTSRRKVLRGLSIDTVLASSFRCALLLRFSRGASIRLRFDAPLKARRVLRLVNGRLFSGPPSRLDAFSAYALGRGCPALPCRIQEKCDRPYVVTPRDRISSSSRQSPWPARRWSRLARR